MFCYKAILYFPLYSFLLSDLTRLKNYFEPLYYFIIKHVFDLSFNFSAIEDKSQKLRNIFIIESTRLKDLLKVKNLHVKINNMIQKRC